MRSSPLIADHTVEPPAAGVPAGARLGDAPHLQALREPGPRLDLAPRHVLQRGRPTGWPARLRRGAELGAGAVAVHLVLASGLFMLLSFRDLELPTAPDEPIEVTVVKADEPERPAAAAGAAARGGGEARDPDRAGAPAADLRPGPPSSAPPAADPKPPRDPAQAAAPARTEPPRAAAAQPAAAAIPPAKDAAPQPGKLVAPPPEAPRAAAQDRDDKPANLQPDERRTEQARREARPAPAPQAMSSTASDASFAVPAPAAPKTEPPPAPTPPTAAKVPSATDRLAAALPMDTSAMPMSFRAVLAGNAAAQINAAYANVVQGRIRVAQADLAEVAYAQHLNGYVALTFTIDDAGRLQNLAVVQSSGDAQLDAMALHALELAAPFPPPPAEAERSFNKAFLVGR